eukprot:1186354-Pyramimonas_sp.AAC.1
MPPGVALLTATAKPLGAAACAALLNSLNAARIGSSFCTPSFAGLWVFPLGGVPGQKFLRGAR